MDNDRRFLTCIRLIRDRNISKETKAEVYKLMVRPVIDNVCYSNETGKGNKKNGHIEKFNKINKSDDGEVAIITGEEIIGGVYMAWEVKIILHQKVQWMRQDRTV